MAAIDFKGSHYPRDVILYAVFFFLRYPVSYRDLEEIMAERGVNVDHSTLNRWVVKYAALVSEEARKRKAATAKSWRMEFGAIRQRGAIIQWMMGANKRAEPPMSR